MVTLTHTYTYAETPCAAASNGASSNGAGKLPPLDIPKPKATKQWALQEADFGQGLVGGKSSNLALLRSRVGILSS